MKLEIINDTSSSLILTYQKEHYDHIVKNFPFYY